MEVLIQEIRHAVRILIRNPLFALIAILTLAIGIGANSAIFSAVYNVILKPLPYKNPDRLVFLFNSRKDIPFMTLSPLDFRDYSRSGPFSETAAYDTGTMDLTGKGDPERLSVAIVSWNYFHLLGMNPVYGRAFVEAEGKYGADRVVILSQALWKRRFDQNPHVVGSSILLDEKEWLIVGVAPAELNYPAQTDLWRPLRFSPEEVDESQRGARWIRVIARLAPGITLSQAQQRIKTLASGYAKQYARTNETLSAVIQPIHGFMVRRIRPALLILWASVGFVLLIAVANVTNLLLAQAVQRENEVAIRTALGAGWGRLLRQSIVESLVLSLIASSGGIFIAIWSTDLLNRFATAEISGASAIHLDSTVLLFTIVIAILTGMLVGLVPALQNVRWTAVQKLKSGARVSSRNRVRKLLVVLEIATALVLLAGAGLLIKSFYRLIDVDPGFRSHNVLTFEVVLPEASNQDPLKVSAFFEEFIRRLETHPEVQSAAGVFGLPLTDNYTAQSSFELTDKPAPPEEPDAGLRVVTPEYFKTMGIPIQSGRSFDSRDTNDSGDVVIISESAAKKWFPNESPIGQRIRIHVSIAERKSVPRTIVGVVGDVHVEGLDVTPQADLYVPQSQEQVDAMAVVVHTKAKAENALPAVRSELRSLDPNLPLSQIRTMDQIVGSSVAQRKFTMLLLSLFAIVGLFLAALGTYGVLAFQVVQRKQEIGIRIALGAGKNDVLKLVLREGFSLAVAGTLIGFLGILGTSRFLRSLLFGVSTTDVATFGMVVLLIAAVAMLACYLPALRATRVDPITTLRYE